jgi:hypothetical protein
LSFALAAIVCGSAVSAQAALNGTEQACSAAIAKAAGKLAKTSVKATGTCLEIVAAGTSSGPCPDAKGQQKIEKAVAKILAAVTADCGSVCSDSASLRCLADSDCPPSAGGGETCTGDTDHEPFSLANLGFPGPHCPALIGGPISSDGDLSDCLSAATEQATSYLHAAVYGSLDGSPALSEQAAACLKAAGKSARKLFNVSYKGAIKCRAEILAGTSTITDPASCTIDDENLATKIAKGRAKLASALGKSCTDPLVGELDLCGNGPGGTVDVDQAATCLGDAAVEVAAPTGPAPNRAYAPIAMTDAAFPPAFGLCGDGLINQLPNPFLLIGEECDLDDDAVCPGECLPPGDLFECTCGNIPRMMSLGVGVGSDLEIGWTGFSHDHRVADGSAFIVDLTGCDCDAASNMTCTGTSNNPVCNTDGRQRPTCSWEVFGPTKCDAHGDGDGLHEDADCAICDGFAANSGASCSADADCQAQCFDAAGMAVSACTTQADCAPGLRCQGRCDATQTCVRFLHGPPLPTSTAGAPSCLVNVFREDVFGTQNIVTGEHERYQQRTTLGHTGEQGARPCPVCGGFCDGLPASAVHAGRACQGTCSGNNADCRFDSDCPSGETCTTASATCGSGFCNLDLVCLGGLRDGEPCRLEGAPNYFGTTSNDCPIDPALNFGGAGTESNFYPSTSEPVTLAGGEVPCTAAAFSLYDCLCPDDNGAPSRPNLCAFACNTGAEFGQGCAIGLGATAGRATTCASGSNAGKACDEDGDCPSSTCSANPKHCVGDPAFALALCTSDANCGTGTCVDACPSGRCVPLCVPSPGDPEDGECAAGPRQFRCAGPNDGWRICTQADAEGGCAATCSVSATPCTSDTACPEGETCQGSCILARRCEAGVDGLLGSADDAPGAGNCVEDELNCFVNGAAAEGGDTFNGLGTPDSLLSVAAYCTEANVSPTANFGAGLGGPGRIRSRSLNVSNGFATLP